MSFFNLEGKDGPFGAIQPCNWRQVGKLVYPSDDKEMTEVVHRAARHKLMGAVRVHGVTYALEFQSEADAKDALRSLYPHGDSIGTWPRGHSVKNRTP